MQLVLLRHADAETVATSDDARPLSEKGRNQAKRVGRFCLEHDIRPDLVLASPLVRTRETARIVSMELGCETVTEAFLTSGATPSEMLDGLRGYRFERLMIVGHEPDFSEAIGCLIGLIDPSCLKIRKATLAIVDIAATEQGCGQLQFLIPARLMS